MSDVPYLSLRDLYMRLGLLSAVEPATEEVMRNRAERSYVDDEFDSPHKLPWFVSMHASSFPGTPADACARALVYRMMNVPGDGSMPSWVTATGEVGKAIEMDLVDAWFKDGRMLAIPENYVDPGDNRLALPVHQLGFVDQEHWLTGSTDLPILPKGWRKVHLVECKAKDDEVLVEMLQGQIIMRDGLNVVVPRGPDQQHVNQLRCTIGLAHEYDWGSVKVCARCWRILEADVYERLTGDWHSPLCIEMPEDCCPVCGPTEVVEFNLESPTSGEIYYASRSWPRGHPRHGKRTKTFFYEHDEAFMDRGKKVLAEARDAFVAGLLPARPRYMQWSALPCSQCRYKDKVCRLDEGLLPRKRKATSEPVKMLDESNAVVHAKSVRPKYNYEDTRAAVLAQWNIEGEESYANS